MKKLIFLLASVCCVCLLCAFLSHNTKPTTQTVAYADTYENESNNSSTTANTIGVNSTVSASLQSSSDVDWFTFTVTEKGFFRIDFEHELVATNSCCWALYLYDETAVNNIGGNNYRYLFTGSEEYEFTGSSGLDVGRYYIKIVNADKYSDVIYNFTVVIEPTVNCEAENNDDGKNATEIKLNTKIKGALYTKADTDWFTFTVTEKGFFRIDFEHELVPTNSYCWTLFLYDESTVNNIGGNNFRYHFTGSEEYEFTGSSGLDVGKYYVKIVCDSYMTKEAYNITIAFDTTQDCETENNDTIEKADKAEVNLKLKGALYTYGDVDWFVFDLNTDAEISLLFSHEIGTNASVCWKAYLYNASGSNSIAQITAVETEPFISSDFVSVSSGRYYVKIVGISDSFSKKSYTLTVSERHDHTGVWEKTEDPTCTVVGKEERVCTVCGLVEEREIPANGHAFGEGVHTREATIVKTGIIEKTCTVCGEKTTEKDWSKAWILPVIILGGIIVVIGVINYIRMLRKN